MFGQSNDQKFTLTRMMLTFIFKKKSKRTHDDDDDVNVDEDALGRSK